MRWITGGPDLPPELLQAQEDGQLVLFCGAGVSYPAGLPGFRGLVEQVYVRLNATMSELERVEFEKSNYDRLFGLLEKRLVGGFVRPAVMAALQIAAGVALPTHRSLLALATTREGVCRIVTTNFDRGFELSVSPGTAIDSAPKLPVPKVGVWNSVVHLHGLISDKDPQGRSLVLTSADFGAAYLTERWASRFISDLFRRFTILFVGYSVEDPVVRYMMDAFAADRALGEGVGKAYVLAPSDAPSRRTNAETWEAKGVIPLLYDESDGHKALHFTLAKWAECHASGLLGRDSIVSEHSSSKRPVKPFDDDPVVSQVLWAITEPSGHSAGHFARLDPVPPIEWLEVFAGRDLFSLPVAPDQGGIRSALVDAGYRSTGPGPLHPVSRALGEWLVRHLDNVDLLNWVLRSGASLHPDFRLVLRRRLDTGPAMPAALGRVWDLLAADSSILWNNVRHPFFNLHSRLATGEWAATLKHDLLDALCPVLTLAPPTLHRLFPDLPIDETKVSHYTDAEVTLRCHDQVRLIRQALDRSPVRERILTDLSDDVTSLLKRALELFEMVQKADQRSDGSYSDQPSISPHQQNSGFRNWTVLIELVRDAWKQLLQADRDRARRLVERWRTIPYPVFRRLCFYAMAESDLYSPQDSLNCLLEDEGWWLWSINVYREKFRLLDAIWLALSDDDADRLTSSILTGLPRAMFREDISDERFAGLSEREVWLHLAKLRARGRDLPRRAAELLENLSTIHTEWRLAEGDRNEFTMWMEGGVGEPTVEGEQDFIDLADETVFERLTAASTDRRNDVARWRRLVSEQPSRATRLLRAMADSGVWPIDLWQAALEGFASDKRSAEEWPELIIALLTAPNATLESVTRPLAWIMHEVAPSLGPDSEDQLWRAWDRLEPFAFRDDDDAAKDPITAALNRPGGLLAQALLDRFAVRRPRSAEDVPEEIWSRLTRIADGQDPSHSYSRVLLASRLAWFHAVNAPWVEQHLMPYFSWQHSPEAPRVWQGYLWQARVTPELWSRIKDDFLHALREKHRLGDFAEQLCTLFGFICIDHSDWLAADEMQTAIRSLDAQGRAAVAHVVFLRLAGAGDKSETMWTTRVAPWLDRVWPKDLTMVEPGSALNLAEAVVHTGGAFEPAVQAVAPFLTPSDQYSTVVRDLEKSEYPERHPSSALQLLDRIVDTECPWPDQTLRDVLNRILGVRPQLATDARYRRIDEYLRRFNL